jgi:Zn-dependent metalloprotease
VETTKFQQYYKGIEVQGGTTFHHKTAQGTRVRNTMSQFDLGTTPTISAEAATAIAQAEVGERELVRAPELKIRPSKNGDSATLIYWVELATQGMSFGADLFIDAHTGKVLANISKLETIAPITILTAKNQGLELVPIKKMNLVTKKEELKGCKKVDHTQNTETTLSLDECKALLAPGATETTQHCQVVLMDSPTSGGPRMLNPANCKQVVSNGVASPAADSSAINALNNSNQVLHYYKDVHGRESFDNLGTTSVSIVHAGIHYANAAWVQGMDFMLYGDGDGELMGDMTIGVDVAGHEMTHGVTSKTAKLTMMNEQGALNEAYADFFGKMIAQDGSWVLGGALSLDKARFPGIRDLKNPGSFNSTHYDGEGNRVSHPYPAKVSEQEKMLDETVCNSSNDRCWVHYNSTIPGHAAYLVHEAIGKTKAETLYYLTLTHYLNSEATFRSSAEATLEACKALTDTGRLTSNDCEATKNVFTQVGML